MSSEASLNAPTAKHREMLSRVEATITPHPPLILRSFPPISHLHIFGRRLPTPTIQASRGTSISTAAASIAAVSTTATQWSVSAELCLNSRPFSFFDTLALFLIFKNAKVRARLRQKERRQSDIKMQKYHNDTSSNHGEREGVTAMGADSPSPGQVKIVHVFMPDDLRYNKIAF